MLYVRGFLFFVFIISVVGCSSVTIKHDFDPEYDFNAYKTYKWMDTQTPDDALAVNPLIAKRVEESVNMVLKEKDYTLIEDKDSAADFAVVIHAGLKERTQIDTYHHSTPTYRGRYGWYNPWWGPYGSTTNVSYYEEGTLVIDIVDIKNKELAWRGMGTKTVKDYDDPDKAQKKIEEIVTKILANFPPN